MRWTSIRVALALLYLGVARADVPAGNAAYERGDYDSALRQWRPAAESGVAEAQYGMGRLYFYGQAVEQSYATAADWYTKAAMQGHARSQANLGHIYEQGLGVEPDPVQAARWYRAAADSGRSVAQRSLGRLYESGKGVPQDLTEAARWYGLAAAQGDDEARAALERLEWTRDATVGAPEGPGPPGPGAATGPAPQFGAGLEAYDDGDYASAMRLWKASAEAGDPNSQYRVGNLYRAGLGVPADLEQAGKWYRRAAEGGQGEAMYHLGFLYLRGRGVSRRVDFGLAHGWFSLAAARGVGDAAVWRDQIEPKLTPKERARSDQLVRDHPPS